MKLLMHALSLHGNTFSMDNLYATLMLCTRTQLPDLCEVCKDCGQVHSDYSGPQNSFWQVHHLSLCNMERGNLK